MNFPYNDTHFYSCPHMLLTLIFWGRQLLSCHKLLRISVKLTLCHNQWFFHTILNMDRFSINKYFEPFHCPNCKRHKMRAITKNCYISTACSIRDYFNCPLWSKYHKNYQWRTEFNRLDEMTILQIHLQMNVGRCFQCSYGSSACRQ